MPLVLLRTEIPEDAFTASILGTERAGNGVVIGDDGLILTIGYLITEAESIWLTTNRGAVVQGHRARLRPAHRLRPGAAARARSACGPSRAARPRRLQRRRRGDRDRPRRPRALAQGAASSPSASSRATGSTCSTKRSSPRRRIRSGAARRWWAKTANCSASARCSCRKRSATRSSTATCSCRSTCSSRSSRICSRAAPPRARRAPGSASTSPRWTGRLVVGGLAPDGPAESAGLQLGDLVLDVAGEPVNGLAALFRRIWSCGPAGSEVPLSVSRRGATSTVRIRSANRNDFLKKPRLH